MASLIQFDETAPINFNLVKEYFTDALAKEGFITGEQADNIKRNYAIVVTKRNWLGQMINKLIFRENSPDEYKIVVMKII